MLRITLAQPRRFGGGDRGGGREKGSVKGHAKANIEDLPDVIRSNARNVSGTIAQSVSGKRERMQFRSRCSRVLQLACDRSCGGGVRSPAPCFLFQKGGVKGSAFRAKQMFLSPSSSFCFLSFLSSSLFPSTYRPPIFRLASARSACSAVFAPRCFLT